MPPPAVPKKPGVWAWFFLVGIVGCVAWSIYSDIRVRWGVALTIAFGAVLTILSRRHFARLKEERKEESICTFARSLPAKAHDTWIVRAVFEQLSDLVQLPIRPTDDLKKDLQIHPDDMDDTAFEIARRAGRSMGDTKKNPMFGKVVTVADLILFLEQQPKEPTQSPESLPPSGVG